MPLVLPFISLRVRFMVVAVLLTASFTSLWEIWSWNRERDLLHERLLQKGEILVSAMAIPIINALLYEELGIISEGGLLDNFIADIMANQQLNPLYAMVLDGEGRVLAHNRFSEYGKIYSDPLTRSALASAGFLDRVLTFEDQRACDLAVPLAIAGKRWGCLRVGVSMEPLYRELALLAGQIILFAGIFSLGALCVFYLVGRGLSGPLTTLARRMEQVNENALPELPPSGRRDEIGLLQTSFSRMLERLRRSEVEREASVQRMLENERLTTVGKIVSGVAHEVNNPLAGIQGALYHIEQKGGAPVQRYVRLVEQSVERIGRIVGQLLDLSRAGAMEMETVHSREFFQDLALFAKMAMKDRGCRFEAKDLCPPTGVRLDRDKIHQVVLNLILNGADAAGAAGRVELQAHDDGRWYCLTVADNGPGIPPELLDRLFETFFTTKEPGKGSGMGLAISRTIAEAHGGSLEFRPGGEGGAVFTLKLPLESAHD
ncbi:MAG: HAMP domain-containing protein [Desulfuromonadales bacterium]|nr:HAMP domain-containing protein [Desulfuromonadales bacterium]